MPPRSRRRPAASPALIGPNGAGKTTLFAIITGFLRPSAGSILYGGEDVTGAPPHRLARRGIARTFQIVQPFAGAHGARQHRGRRASAPSRAPRRAGGGRAGRRARSGSADLLDRPADSLTVAGRKRLELARALATEPKLLLLDEVLAGLNPSEIRDIVPVVRAIRDRGVTIVMVEHVMQAVMSSPSTSTCWPKAASSPRARRPRSPPIPKVIEAYLGRGAAAKLAEARMA